MQHKGKYSLIEGRGLRNRSAAPFDARSAGISQPHGRHAAFRAFCWLARHAPWSLEEAREASSFIRLAEQGKRKQDDLLQRVTVRRLASWIESAGFERVHEDLYVTGFFRRFLPGRVRRLLANTPWAQDVMIGHIQCVLAKP